MSTTGYVIAFNDLQKPGYTAFGVLTTTYATIEDAKAAMAFRAEEVIDELVSVDAENDRESGGYEIQSNDNGESIAVVEPDGGIMGSRRVHTVFMIQPIEV